MTITPFWLAVISALAPIVLQHLTNKLKMRLPDWLHPVPVDPGTPAPKTDSAKIDLGEELAEIVKKLARDILLSRLKGEQPKDK